jgi:hypothetical protein
MGSQLELQIDFPNLMIVTSSEITRHYFGLCWLLRLLAFPFRWVAAIPTSSSSFTGKTQESVESHGEDLQGQ